MQPFLYGHRDAWCDAVPLLSAAERWGHLLPGGHVFVLGAVHLSLDFEKAWHERQSWAGETSIPVQCAVKSALSIAHCLKPGQALALVHPAEVKEGEGMLNGGFTSPSAAFPLFCVLPSEKCGRETSCKQMPA